MIFLTSFLKWLNRFNHFDVVLILVTKVDYEIT